MFTATMFTITFDVDKTLKMTKGALKMTKGALQMTKGSFSRSITTRSTFRWIELIREIQCWRMR